MVSPLAHAEKMLVSGTSVTRSHCARADDDTLSTVNATTAVNAIFTTCFLFRELVQVAHERHRGAVESFHLGIGRFDHVVLVRRVRAASLPEAEVSRRELERLAREHVAGIRA